MELVRSEGQRARIPGPSRDTIRPPRNKQRGGPHLPVPEARFLSLARVATVTTQRRICTVG